MKRVAAGLLGIMCFAALAGCSLPGRAFPGGPSPWLPGGAPGSVYAPSSTTQAAPHSASQGRPAPEQGGPR